MGVLVNLEECFLHVRTSVSDNGVTWGWGSPSLVFLVPSNCFSGATVLLSCGGDLGLSFCSCVKQPYQGHQVSARECLF